MSFTPSSVWDAGVPKCFGTANVRNETSRAENDCRTCAFEKACWDTAYPSGTSTPPPEAPTAPSLLERAAKHMRDREAVYDAPGGERSMGKTVAAFNAITGRDLTEPEGWLLMQILKDVRLFARPGYHADSAEDCIAYAALKAEAKGSKP